MDLDSILAHTFVQARADSLSKFCLGYRGRVTAKFRRTSLAGPVTGVFLGGNVQDGKTLMQIESDAMEVQRAILMADGELTPELEGYLNTIEVMLEEKAHGYVVVMKQLEAFEAYLGERADEYHRKADMAAKIRDSMKERIKRTMLNLDKQKISGGDFSITLGKAAPVLSIDIEKLPSGYVKEKIVKSADRTMIKVALDRGEEIPGVEKLPNHSLLIKLADQKRVGQ